MNKKTSRLALWTSLAAAGAAALAVRAFVIEPNQVELSEHDLPVPELPPDWEGARIVHLTDLHYGDPHSDRLFPWMVETVNELGADLIVITGDYVLRTYAEGRLAARHMKRLRSRHGMVGVLGDHDFCRVCREPIHGIETLLGETGLCLLRNNSVELPGGLRIAGVDPTTRKIQRGRLGEALASLSGHQPHLLLSHSPDILTEAAEHAVPVVLCGHTHGGQVVVPFYGPPVTHTRISREYCSGWSTMDKTRMYTGRGLASHYSLRFLCRPEISLFTLRAA